MPVPPLSIAVEKLTPGTAVIMVAFADIAVVRIAPAFKTDFNRSLRSELNAFRPNVAFGVFDRSQYKNTDEDHKRLVAKWQAELGVDSSFGVPAGYYLFLNKQLVAYHPPLADDDDANEQIAKATLAGLGLLAALLFQSQDRAKQSDDFAKASATVLESEPGKKAAAFFTKIISDAEAAAQAAAAEKKARDADEARRKAQAKILDDAEAQKETWAFKLFDLVRGTATEKDAKSAWCALLVKVHPDKGPESEAGWRNAATAQANEAHGLVVRCIKLDAANALTTTKKASKWSVS